MDDNKPQSPLEIPELLENVLLHLTQGEILQAQRVNHFWLDTIFESPSLQQKLFFQPLPPSKAAGRPAELNPIVRDLLPFLFVPGPFKWRGGWFTTGKAEEAIQHWAADPSTRQAVLRPEASWRRMLPVQPAAPIDAFVMNEFTFCVGIGEYVSLMEWCKVDPSRHISSSAARSNLGGNATVGLLYDIVVPHLSSARDSGICVQWNMMEETHDPRYKKFLSGGGEVKPHNAITIHAIEGFDDEPISQMTTIAPVPRTGVGIVYFFLKKTLLASVPEWWGWNAPRPANSTGLGVILDLPAGVVQAGNKANRYPEGNLEDYYSDYGRLDPGLESELEIELNEGAKDGLSALD